MFGIAKHAGWGAPGLKKKNTVEDWGWWTASVNQDEKFSEELYETLNKKKNTQFTN